jgi:hypothetical protein
MQILIGERFEEAKKHKAMSEYRAVTGREERTRVLTQLTYYVTSFLALYPCEH